MTTWVLILTLFLSDGSQGGAHAAASVQSVTGFKSQESCMTAANMWLRQMRDRGYNGFSARAMCTRQ